MFIENKLRKVVILLNVRNGNILKLKIYNER